MAFCNSCGATLDAAAKFCNKCGKPNSLAAVPAAAGTTPGTPATPGAATPAPTGGGSSALKVILIIVAVIVVIGVLGVATLGFIGWRIAKSSHVRQEGDNVKVETPFGNVDTSSNPADIAKNLSVDLYPGAEIKKEGTATATMFGVSTVSVNLETSDSVDQVASFYKPKFPNANVSTCDTSHCTIVSNDKNGMTTITIQGDGGRTRIQIATVTRKSDSGKSSSN